MLKRISERVMMSILGVNLYCSESFLPLLFLQFIELTDPLAS